MAALQATLSRIVAITLRIQSLYLFRTIDNRSISMEWQDVAGGSSEHAWNLWINSAKW